MVSFKKDDIPALPSPDIRGNGDSFSSCSGGLSPGRERLELCRESEQDCHWPDVQAMGTEGKITLRLVN